MDGNAINVCTCGSWIQHWRNHSRQIANVCRAFGCSRSDLLGAHVQKDYTYDNHWYIVPFCTHHNNSAGTIELVSGTNLVSANRSMTGC